MSYHSNILEESRNIFSQEYRERTGRFFTPPQWVKLSQKYLADVLGVNWQNEYYVWDCAAGTGNLLEGLTNPYNIWASTLDQADVDVMKERIAKKGAMLLEPHVFQFDFLNDSFDKLPQQLLDIINDPEKRKKLVIYINPPYAEASNSKSIAADQSRNKPGVSQKDGYVYKKYQSLLGRGINEVFVQFLIRIYKEIPSCLLGHFSTPKILQANNFVPFRKVFRAKLKCVFLVPASTFDNVNGQFPIGFYLWDTAIAEPMKENILADVYNSKQVCIGKKNLFCPSEDKVIMAWLQKHYDKKSQRLAYIVRGASNFQSNTIMFITLSPSPIALHYSRTSDITANNLRENAIYYAVRCVIPATWLNNHDQFLYPNDSWETDTPFQTDCLTYTLFSNKNHISAKHGVNHWIPFTEMEVRPQDNFSSHFMTDYMQGKIKAQEENPESALAKQKSSIPTAPLSFSPAAQAVFDAGRELWKYYHSKVTEITPITVNASLYDIKEYFQGRSDKGRMKPKSEDEQYNELISTLREKLKFLTDQIEPKVYEHGFLKKYLVAKKNF